MLRWVRELRAGAGVEEHSRRLFLRYHARLSSFLRRRGFSSSQADDLLQEIFLQVFRQIASFREESTFEGWLFAIAANIVRNELRRRDATKRSAAEVPLDSGHSEEDSGGLDLPAECVTPERSAFESQRWTALRQAIENLPPQMRRCLELRVHRELEYREIASLMKLNVNTVKAHLFQARQRLKDALGQEYGEWRE